MQRGGLVELPPELSTLINNYVTFHQNAWLLKIVMVYRALLHFTYLVYTVSQFSRRVFNITHCVKFIFYGDGQK
jgi:hypothetical protein